MRLNWQPLAYGKDRETARTDPSINALTRGAFCEGSDGLHVYWETPLCIMDRGERSALFARLISGRQHMQIFHDRGVDADCVESQGVHAEPTLTAEILWLRPSELISWVQEPLRAFLYAEELPRDIYENSSGAEASGVRSNSEADEKAIWEQEDLADKATRYRYLRALRKAWRHRACLSETRDNSDLKVAELILRHYSRYQSEIQEGFMKICPTEFLECIRRPTDWRYCPASKRWAGKIGRFETGSACHKYFIENEQTLQGRSLGEYVFEEVRCFFIRQARLYVNGTLILDAACCDVWHPSE